MKKRNQITQAALLAVAAVSSVGAMAEDATVQATVSVDNTIDFAGTGSLSFGTLRAVADITNDANCSFLVLRADPSTTTLVTTASLAPDASAACGNKGASAISSVGGTLSRPSFTIGGVAGFTTLAVTVPDEVDMEAALAPGAAVFTLSDFTLWKTTGTPGAIALSTQAGTVQVDGTGAATFTLGAAIRTTENGNGATQYENDIPYSGDILVTVAYQ